MSTKSSVDYKRPDAFEVVNVATQATDLLLGCWQLRVIG